MMKLADYRERLGLGFDDKSKFEALKNRFSIFASNLGGGKYSRNDCCEYFIAIGKPWDRSYDSSYQVSNSFQECSSLKEVVLNAVALYNSYKAVNNNYAKHHDGTTSNVLEYIMYATGNILRLLITLKNPDARAL